MFLHVNCCCTVLHFIMNKPQFIYCLIEKQDVFSFYYYKLLPLQGTSLYGSHQADMFESFSREGIAESWGALLFTPNQKSQIAFQSDCSKHTSTSTDLLIGQYG